MVIRRGYQKGMGNHPKIRSIRNLSVLKIKTNFKACLKLTYNFRQISKTYLKTFVKEHLYQPVTRSM